MNRRRACALPVVVAAALVLAWTSGARASLRNPDTDWMSGHYGIGFHYIQNWMGATKDGGPVEWNAAVDSFDVNRFASDAASTGARWVLFTSGQNSGYYVAPCAYMNSFSGYRPGERCSNRDLLQDMGNALAARGLRLVIYLPANAPKSDARIANGFGLTTKDSNGNWHVNDAFTQKWSGVVREWSLRYGDHVGAWWFDGFYGGNGFVSSMGHWYSEAARAGNAHEIIALNGGASSFDRRSEAQDYIAGESGSLSKNCTSRWLQDVQCHTFITLGSWGGADPIKYNDDQIVSHTNSNLTVGAAMTWNIGVSSNGIIKSTHLAIFQRIRSRLVGSEPPGPTPTPGPTATPTPTRTPTPTPMPDGDFVEITPAASAVSASTNDGNLPGNTVDNSLATRWSANGDGQWIQYDLGTTRTVSRVKVAVYNGNSRRNHFELQLSACCGTWATVFSGESSGTTTAEAAYDFAAQDARYVRYLGHGNSVNAFNSVTEVSLFAPAGPPTPVSTPTPTPPPTSTPTPGPTPLAMPRSGRTQGNTT